MSEKQLRREEAHTRKDPRRGSTRRREEANSHVDDHVLVWIIFLYNEHYREAERGCTGKRQEKRDRANPASGNIF